MIYGAIWALNQQLYRDRKILNSNLYLQQFLGRRYGSYWVAAYRYVSGGLPAPIGGPTKWPKGESEYGL